GELEVAQHREMAGHAVVPVGNGHSIPMACAGQVRADEELRVLAKLARSRHRGAPMRSILITGAASGIGAGIARELAAAGHHLVVSDLSAAAAGEVAASIRAHGGSAEAVALDVTSDASVAAALA